MLNTQVNVRISALGCNLLYRAVGDLDLLDKTEFHSARPLYGWGVGEYKMLHPAGQ